MFINMQQTNTHQDEQIPLLVYDSFENFLQIAIKEYSGQGRWKNPNFIALLLASGQTGALAKSTLTSAEGLKKIALGTVGIMAARALLTRLLAGPLALVLTGISIVSLIGVLIKNQKEIFQKVTRFKELISHTRTRYEETQMGYKQSRIDARERNLMVEGLLKRFLADCDEI